MICQVTCYSLITVPDQHSASQVHAKKSCSSILDLTSSPRPPNPCNRVHSFIWGRRLYPGSAGERLFIKWIDKRGDQSLAVVPYLSGIIIQERSCPSVCSSPPLNYIQSLHRECSPCASSQMLSLQAFSYKLMLKPEWLMRLAKQLYLWPDCIKLALSI